jgi:thiol-disulfide isomerase/thioredoxin
MKNILLPALVLAVALPVSAQQRASVPMSAKTIVPVSTNATGDPAADHEHDALWAAWRAVPPDGLTRTNRAYWEWQDKVFKKFAADAQAFAQKYPKDPRRWEAIVQSGFTPPWFITGFKPEFDAQPGQTNLIVDEAALAAFKTNQAGLNREVILADDATPRGRVGALGWMLTEETVAARNTGRQPDFAKLEPLMLELAEKVPDERGAELLTTYLALLRKSSPDEADSFGMKLQELPVGNVLKELAAKQEQARQMMVRADTGIGSIKFTSVDGRPVDLTKLRGKVVLVDFWGTWCGPCVAEMPNIVSNYTKYHGRGFEVVGIAVEHFGLDADDGADAKEKKIATIRQKLLAFTKKNNMPWPQHLDVKNPQNEFVEKFGIHLFPSMFLLGKDGTVASTEARGPDLEKEIKRLLGI